MHTRDENKPAFISHTLNVRKVRMQVKVKARVGKQDR